MPYPWRRRKKWKKKRGWLLRFRRMQKLDRWLLDISVHILCLRHHQTESGLLNEKSLSRLRGLAFLVLSKTRLFPIQNIMGRRFDMAVSTSSASNASVDKFNSFFNNKQYTKKVYKSSIEVDEWVFVYYSRYVPICFCFSECKVIISEFDARRGKSDGQLLVREGA